MPTYFFSLFFIVCQSILPKTRKNNRNKYEKEQNEKQTFEVIKFVTKYYPIILHFSCVIDCVNWDVLWMFYAFNSDWNNRGAVMRSRDL